MVFVKVAAFTPFTALSVGASSAETVLIHGEAGPNRGVRAEATQWLADMGTIISVYYPQEFASYGIADLPLDNPDAWVGMRATDELFRNNAAIRSVDDIDGLKVRGVGTSLPDSVVLVRAAIILPLAAVTANRAHVCAEVLVKLLPRRITQGLILGGWLIGMAAFWVRLLLVLIEDGRAFLHRSEG